MVTEGPLSQVYQEGGAITSIQSNVIFTGVTSLSNNQASSGGAILAIESSIMMALYSLTIIANNTAINGSGGDIFLHQSYLEITGNCSISGNHAVRGGGIYATGSNIATYQPGTLQFINNRAENGSGLYLKVNVKLNILKNPKYHIAITNTYFYSEITMPTLEVPYMW